MHKNYMLTRQTALKIALFLTITNLIWCGLLAFVGDAHPHLTVTKEVLLAKSWVNGFMTVISWGVAFLGELPNETK